MAIELISNTLGLTNLYAILRRDTDSFVWNGTGFETMVSANWANYLIALPETPAGSGIYRAAYPTAFVNLNAPGLYTVTYYQQIGASASINDLKKDTKAMAWNGNSERTVLTDSTGKVTVGTLPTAPTGYGGGGLTTDEHNALLQTRAAHYGKLVKNSDGTYTLYDIDDTTVIATMTATFASAIPYGLTNRDANLI